MKDNVDGLEFEVKELSPELKKALKIIPGTNLKAIYDGLPHHSITQGLYYRLMGTPELIDNGNSSRWVLFPVVDDNKVNRIIPHIYFEY